MLSTDESKKLKALLDGYIAKARGEVRQRFGQSTTVEKAFSNLYLNAHEALTRYTTRSGDRLTVPPDECHGFSVPNSQFKNQVLGSADRVGRDTALGRKMFDIADTPVALWIGDWPGSMAALDNALTAAHNSRTRLRFAAYNIPDRDLGNYSHGGATGPDAYKAWWKDIRDVVGDYPSDIILEPDAIGHALRMPGDRSDERLELLSETISQMPLDRWRVYLDAGHATWPDVDALVPAIRKAGGTKTKRIALNVSNMHSRTSCNKRFTELQAKVPELKGYLVDTSRSGCRDNDEWCNPMWAKFGPPEPTEDSTFDGCEIEMYVKLPGQSDGTCNGGPNAGEWFHDYFVRMVRNTYNL